MKPKIKYFSDVTPTVSIFIFNNSGNFIYVVKNQPDPNTTPLTRGVRLKY